tara:strand:- start:720 stop:1040 length:321 start_codon:yes stop_codon:yes gene_type:complete
VHLEAQLPRHTRQHPQPVPLRQVLQEPGLLAVGKLKGGAVLADVALDGAENLGRQGGNPAGAGQVVARVVAAQLFKNADGAVLYLSCCVCRLSRVFVCITMRETKQ